MLSLIVLTLGCSSGEEAKLPVSGAVTLNGSPLADVNVMMIRDDGLNAMVTTDASGKFSIGGEGQAAGVPAGTYKVGVTPNTAMESSDVAGLAAAPKTSFAPKYMSTDTSGLSITVAQGMAPVALELKGK